MNVNEPVVTQHPLSPAMNEERAQKAVQTSAIGVGVLGLGTVGCGVVKALRTQAETIAHAGWLPQIRRILVRNLEKPRAVTVERALLTTDRDDLLRDPAIQVVIEVIGGIEPARTCITEALLAGKHVITANKELLAKHGAQLMALARKQGVRLLFEASVAGGIPIIRMVEAYLTANRIVAIRGILNGTCNYILTQMEERELTFAQALLGAQELGYAEADPESDIEGYDAAYKLCILANLAFVQQTPISAVKRSGITAIAPIDLKMAKHFGAVLKLIGSARVVDGRPSLEVGLRFLPLSDALASVRDVFNAVTITADVVGDLTFIGRGAGELPTASAVIEDLMEVLRSPQAVYTRDAAHEGRLREALADAMDQEDLQTVDQGVARTPVLYVRLRKDAPLLTGSPTPSLQALAAAGVTCSLLQVHAFAPGAFDVIALLHDADEETVRLLEQLLDGSCAFCAPFDAPLPQAQLLQATMS